MTNDIQRYTNSCSHLRHRQFGAGGGGGGGGLWGGGGAQSKGTSLSSSDFNMNDSISTHHHHPQILPENLNLLEAHYIIIYSIYNRYAQWKTLSCGSGDGSVVTATVSKPKGRWFKSRQARRENLFLPGVTFLC